VAGHLGGAQGAVCSFFDESNSGETRRLKSGWVRRWTAVVVWCGVTAGGYAALGFSLRVLFNGF
jgi:hypothetical protein